MNREEKKLVGRLIEDPHGSWVVDIMDFIEYQKGGEKGDLFGMEEYYNDYRHKGVDFIKVEYEIERIAENLKGQLAKAYANSLKNDGWRTVFEKVEKAKRFNWGGSITPRLASRVASRYLEKQSIQKEANFFYKIKRLFSKGIKQHEQEIKKMGFKIINRDEDHTKFKNERIIGYGEVIEYTWSVETPGGYFAKIKWTDILGKGMWFEGKSYVGKDEWNRYYKEPMWNEKYRERYKKNKGFFTWEISTYMNDNFIGGRIGYERFVKTKDAYRYMNRLSKAQKSDDPYDQELRLANGNLEKQGFNKYNVPELVGQLMSVLEKNGLEDTVAELKQRGFTKIINKAWQGRNK